MASHPRRAYVACLDCGIAGKPGDGLSMRGLCPHCAVERQSAAIRQMAAKSGPKFEQWQRSMIDYCHDFLRSVEASS